ncbi:prolipoprotein diacylglyceryl transferase [Sediminispirochaeta smaragdinae]|uniref:Phosphatidylglycerol--prolipoprotein diacylglyceryl transferase n=1 Tax=Sediminispirochaeta smaragdinae (strain DSM 11293 / JCM 15392 / SEBR 4228) TaxID=573413 RepID=E1R8H0_SEDSS|nr:prolipoprotein diacylglyceryl transferase [Sediminispirochaeta smaragdinae]ADK79314.1 prolipoprotein diacylglyceryl transferase [Sediminispirochaeta smaragdinae DSM 11293]
MIYINYPEWISPQIIPGLPFHWYGMMYLVAFGITYLLFNYQRKHGEIAVSEDQMAGIFFWVILGLLIGARIVATLVYDTSGQYLRRPWLIFWPFDEHMHLVGLQGMSYHGGLIGGVVAGVLYCRKEKISFWAVADTAVAGIPLGYTFGRLGNFINGELWGRVTASPLGMIFPHAPGLSSRYEWVRRIADSVGIGYSPGSLVNLPRHPSQLYEAFFEGVFLWLIIWFVFRKRKQIQGTLLGVYLIGYGIIRFFIEYFRQPDADIGFPIALGPDSPPSLFLSPLNISTGQIFCFAMILAGIAVIVFRRLVSSRKAGS